MIASNRSNSVSTLHSLNKSLPNMSHTFLNQLFWWRKLRKTKSVANTNSFSNVCVIMKSEQSCITQCFHSQTSVTPAVTFINRGEGVVSMQLMDRIMINENELYSMGLSDYTQNHNFLSLSQSLETSINKSDFIPQYCIEDNQWFYGSITRQKAVEILENRPIGSFAVRHSSTQQNCFAMSLRVPNDYHLTGIAHYLILETERNAFKIKGFTKEFQSLESLIIHHSILKELLPCPLLLPNNQLIGKNISYSPSFELKNQNKQIEDILVDIDSDPNYQKILIDFRKTMFKIN